MNLNQVTVPSLNIKESIRFYQKLGLKLIVHTHDAYARFELPDGDSTFSLHLADEVLPSQIHVYFECNKLDLKIEELRGFGVSIIEEVEDKPWRWREVKISDPSGNTIILYQAGVNRKFPPWRLKE